MLDLAIFTLRKALAFCQEFQTYLADKANIKKIDPNVDSNLKIESYSMSLTQKIVWGIPAVFVMRESPDTQFRIKYVITNAPAEGLFIRKSLMVANIDTMMGACHEDCSRGINIDAPTIYPSNSVVSEVEYTGTIPPGFSRDCEFQFCMTLLGVSTIVGIADEMLKDPPPDFDNRVPGNAPF